MAINGTEWGFDPRMVLEQAHRVSHRVQVTIRRPPGMDWPNLGDRAWTMADGGWKYLSLILRPTDGSRELGNYAITQVLLFDGEPRKLTLPWHLFAAITPLDVDCPGTVVWDTPDADTVERHISETIEHVRGGFGVIDGGKS